MPEACAAFLGVEGREILLRRRQVALRERCGTVRLKLNWADRALFAALLAVMPRAHHGELRLSVAPGTILRRHRDLVRSQLGGEVAAQNSRSPGRLCRGPSLVRGYSSLLILCGVDGTVERRGHGSRPRAVQRLPEP